MKFIKGIILAVILLFMLIMGIAVPFAFIGTAVFLIGLYLSNQKKKGNIIVKKPGLIVTAGLILFLILGVSFADTTETADKNNENQLASTTAQKDSAEKEAAEIAKKEEEEEKAKAEAEARAKEEAKAEEERLEKEKLEAEQNAKEEQASTLGLELVTISRVVDGDTVETSDGRKVRLVGVNTPESTTKTEEYGKEASNYTTSKLEGKQVYLQKDVSDTDRYARYLRIVWLDIPTNDMDENEIRSKMFNADLVLNGYAEPSTYPPDVKYSDYFVKFAREAREQNTGLWAFGAEGTTKGDLDSKTTASSSGSTSSSSNNTNNNTKSSTNSNTGSTPAAPSTSSNESYKNCTELRKVYPNGVPADHPAYDSKHDRDKDNWACER
ncbi:thermonuclease family protein [Bacillus sp. DTU_2020_1000418_1_SI_GHA_SEK_038]|uniref:thermonuclease family protein n=1 Tax=Bacillus sp. DTU_2020_1000418_1_SI_GHA_SEK_038 TaxID=3077585 RepID=UPI0028EE7ACB|nr:thermonuclease family protein [Bacillus sp. DTU_2020_1000418_1_SI_GHA_SEK_038]WNS77278.1 thermonuclease family protein [Bacillus sp. DTU_2020_1000418_1_SI_GHA_SEK_038]